MLQRVRSARVTAGGAVAGEIGVGLLIFVGIASDDGRADVEYIAGKTRDLRIFPDEHGRMNRAISEAGGAVLVVSQFTLHADCRKGRRPSFDGAAPGTIARALYEDLIAALRARSLTVSTGVFQAEMDVELVNDGPVTILLDSKRMF